MMLPEGVAKTPQCRNICGPPKGPHAVGFVPGRNRRSSEPACGRSDKTVPGSRGSPPECMAPGGTYAGRQWPDLSRVPAPGGRISDVEHGEGGAAEPYARCGLGKQ